MRLIELGYREDQLPKAAFFGTRYDRVVYLYYGDHFYIIKHYDTPNFRLNISNPLSLLNNRIIEL